MKIKTEEDLIAALDAADPDDPEPEYWGVGIECEHGWDCCPICDATASQGGTKE